MSLKDSLTAPAGIIIRRYGFLLQLAWAIQCHLAGIFDTAAFIHVHSHIKLCAISDKRIREDTPKSLFEGPEQTKQLN